MIKPRGGLFKGRGLIVNNELWHEGLFKGGLNRGEGAKSRIYGMCTVKGWSLPMAVQEKNSNQILTLALDKMELLQIIGIQT